MTVLKPRSRAISVRLSEEEYWALRRLCSVGEGGMVTTNSADLWNNMWSLKDHGKSYDAVYHRKHAPGFKWLHESIGTNWRLSEVQSAVGRMQLRKLPAWVARRRAHAAKLTSSLAVQPGLRITTPPKHINHSYYKYYAFICPEDFRPSWNRDRVLAEIVAQGIPCFSGSCSEIYLENAFPAEWRPANRLPVARELGENALMFLVHPTLTDDDVARTCSVVRQVMREAVR
jgi:dTDP-4-amino-4,6-dideoxygalactose transaminase